MNQQQRKQIHLVLLDISKLDLSSPKILGAADTVHQAAIDTFAKD